MTCCSESYLIHIAFTIFFYLVFLVHGWSWVSEIVGSGASNKKELLCLEYKEPG